MERHRIAYIDESNDELIRFQQRMDDTFEVFATLPQPNLDEFVHELLTLNVKAFVADFRLNEYRSDTQGTIAYNGAELIEALLSIRQGFPCFVLTSYDNDAVTEIGDVNYVYPKEILTTSIGQVPLAEKIRIQIEHYQARIAKSNARFHELLRKSELTELTEVEENELLNLDSYLERSLNSHNVLPPEKKELLSIGRLNDLIESTQNLLKALREQK